MAVTTVTVDFSAILQTAAQATGVLRVRLSQVGTVEDSETGQTVVIPITWQETTLTSGAASLSLVPNALIDPSCTYYDVQFKSIPSCPKECSRILLSGIMYVPNQDCSIMDILIAPKTGENPGTASAYASQAKQSAAAAEYFAVQAGDRYQDVQDAAATALDDIGSAKADALVAIADDKQEALGAIADAKADATGAIADDKRDALSAISDAKVAAVEAVQGQQATSVEAVQNEGTAQVERVTSEGGVQTGNVTAEGNAQVIRVTSTGNTQSAIVSSAGGYQYDRIVTEGGVQVQAVTSAGAVQSGYIVSAGSAQIALVNSAGATQSAAVVSAGGAQITAVNSAGAVQSAAVVSAGAAQITSIGSAGAAQISAVTSTGGVQVGLVQSAGTAQIALVQSAGAAEVQAIEDAGEVYQAQIDDNAQRIENINEYAEGQLYTYQTDSTEAYVKSVPDGVVQNAEVQSIAGKTLVWNQLLPTTLDDWIVNTTYGTGTHNTDGSISYNITTAATSASFYIAGDATDTFIKKGHKYYLAFDVVPLGTAVRFGYNVNQAGTEWYNLTVGTRVLLEKIWEPTADETAKTKYLYPSWAGNTTGTSILYAAKVVDLTLLYGAGNEPTTVGQFHDEFPAIYYAYNPGTLLSAGVTDVKSVGKNLCDVFTRTFGEMVNGSNASLPRVFDYTKYYKGATGSNIFSNVSAKCELSDNAIIYTASSGGYYGVGFPFRVLPGEQVTCSLVAKLVSGSHGMVLRLSYYDENGYYVSFTDVTRTGSGTVSKTVTIPDGIRTLFVTLCPNTNGEEWSFSDIQLELGSTATSYTPYQSSTLTIPASVQALPGYGWSAGSAKNVLDLAGRKFTQNVGSVDLGSLNYSYNASYGFYFNAANIGMKNTDSNTTVGNLLCPLYQAATYSAVGSGQNNMLIGVGTGTYCLINNNSYTDAAAFKAAMQGVMLYYELATPVVTTIDPLDTMLAVEDGGTIEFQNVNGYDYRIPVESSVRYKEAVDLTGRVADAEDAIAQNTEDIATNTADIATNAASIASLDTKTDITDKNVDNVLALLKGALSAEQIDSAAAYHKTVPAKAQPWAGVQEVGGRTVVWNQLLNDTSSSVSAYANCTGTYTASTHSYNCTVSADDASYTGIQFGISTIEANHKLLCAVIVSGATFTNTPTKVQFLFRGTQNTGSVSVDYTGNSTYFAISEPTVSVNRASFYVQGTTKTGDTFALGSFMVIDLTLMFGAGNEPATVDAFRAMFPASYYAYNLGSLISAGVTGVVSRGRNLCDEGVVVSSTTGTRLVTLDEPTFFENLTISFYCQNVTYTSGSAGFIAINDGTTATYILTSMVIKEDGTTFSVNMAPYTGRAYVTATNKTVLTVSMLAQSGAWSDMSGTITDVQVEASATMTPYSAPFITTLPIPSAVLDATALGYGWTAGSASNYKNGENWVQEVECIKFSTISWNAAPDWQNEGYYSFSLNGKIKNAASNTTVGNISCVGLETKTRDEIVEGDAIGIAVSNGGVLALRLPSGKTLDDYAGANVYYELATHKVTPFDDAITYGWSAGVVCNEIDFKRKVYIQRVGSVDLGTLTWDKYSASSGVYRFNAALSGIKKALGTNTTPNLTCTKYLSVTNNQTWTGTTGVTSNVSYNSVMITDANYYDSTGVQFKAAMSGVMLNYELETPIEIDISDLLSDDNLIAVESGGTVTFPNQLGDDYRLPVPSDVDYTIDIAPDTPSTDGTYTLQCTVADGVATYSWVSA